MGVRLYAEGTSVPVMKTQTEIDTLVRRKGATGIIFGASTTPAVDGKTPARSQSLVVIEMKTRRLRFIIPMPTPGRTETKADTGRRLDEEKRRWRALLLVLKAKFEAVASGIVTFDEEFLAHIVVGPGGETVGDQIVPGIAAALSTGKLPKLLGPGAS